MVDRSSTSPKAKRRIAIIGGGLSGLATAAKLHLADASLDLSLFEASDRVGGVIQSERDQGFLIDHGADMFSTKPSAAIDFCEQLGITDRLIEPNPTRRGARIVRRGRLVPIPDGFVLMRATQLLPMLTTPLLSLPGKLRFLAERWIPPTCWEGDADESISSFVRRRMGREVLDRIVAPLSAGIYTADIDKLSMRATMRPIAEMERQYGSLAKATSVRRRQGEDSIERASTGARYGQFRAFQNGMIELIRNLATVLPEQTIELSSAVQSIIPDGVTWKVNVEGRQRAFDHVVIAVPPAAACKLLAQLAPLAAAPLQAMESASTAIVVLGVRKSDVRRDIETFGFVIPPSEQRRILAGSFASHKFAGRAPDDHVLIRAFVGGATQPEILEMSDQELVQIVRAELAELIGLGGSPVITRVVRWNHAMPQYHVGHCARVAQIEKAMDDLTGLWLVNNALHGVGIAPVIDLADRTAGSILSSFTSSG